MQWLIHTFSHYVKWKFSTFRGLSGPFTNVIFAISSFAINYIWKKAQVFDQRYKNGLG
jgi:hypothetical protein